MMAVEVCSGFDNIAHRGASGYLPEHTAVSSAMAHGMGADFIEHDVAFTRDGVAVVIHDIVLDTTTDVAARFPDRARADGRFYLIDFTMEEVRELRKGERFNISDGTAVYPKRYPVGRFDFPLMTLGEGIALIAGMDASAGRITGLYPELKRPEFYLQNGLDPVPLFMAALEAAGALEGQRPCFIQCFHAGTLKRIRADYGEDLSLIQLIGENAWEESSDDYDAMRTADGLAEIASYADGIGLPLARIVENRDGALTWRPLKAMIQAQGLTLHPYTVRKETLPEGVSMEEMMAFLAGPDGVDGVFTDFPDYRGTPRPR